MLWKVGQECFLRGKEGGGGLVGDRYFVFGKGVEGYFDKEGGRGMCCLGKSWGRGGRYFVWKGNSVILSIFIIIS